MPPNMSTICWRAAPSLTPVLRAISMIMPCAPEVSMKPGEIMVTRTPLGATPLARPLL
jgi:hypothetical protein